MKKIITSGPVFSIQESLNSLHVGYLSMLLLSSADFFSN